MNNELTQVAEVLQKAKAEVGKIIIGQEKVVERALITIFTNSHALIEGVPGVAKTLLVRTLAHVLGCDFSRIQFTPDLMPTDITGTNMFNMQKNEFTLVKGPVFTTFLLADEINRAPAKTQSALLQAMQERLVSIDRETLVLSPEFTVFATQNPIEYEGTYPLPEAQKDRFQFKIMMECPERDHEIELGARMLGEDSPESALARGDAGKVIDLDELPRLRKAFETVTVREELLAYMVDLVRTTRNHETVLVGASPRATQSLILSSRVHAVLDDRDFVTPDDIKEMAYPVLAHRLILRPEFEIEGVSVDEVIGRILQEVAVPR